MVSEAAMTTSSSSSSKTLNVFSPSAPSPLSHVKPFIFIKLTSTNNLFWKIQLLPFLRGQNLLGYVDGSFSCLSSHIIISGKEDPLI